MSDLSVPLTEHDLTQGHFIEGIREEEVVHKSRLMCCWS